MSSFLVKNFDGSRGVYLVQFVVECLIVVTLQLRISDSFCKKCLTVESADKILK